MQLLAGYFCPVLLALFALYASPWLNYKVMMVENHELKSEKDRSFLEKLNNGILLDLLLWPLISFAFVSDVDSLPSFFLRLLF